MTAFIAAATADAGQLPAEIAGGVDLGRAVLAERRGEAVGVAADERRRRPPSERALVSSSSVPVVGAPFGVLCEHPDVVDSHVRLTPQMTFRFSRNADDLGEAPRRRLRRSRRRRGRSACATDSAISWPAPAQPTGATPRSAAVTVSTGFDLAAMMPLKLG